MCRHFKRIFLLLVVLLLTVQPLFVNAEFEKSGKAEDMNNINIPSYGVSYNNPSVSKL